MSHEKSKYKQQSGKVKRQMYNVLQMYKYMPETGNYIVGKGYYRAGSNRKIFGIIREAVSLVLQPF